MVVFSLLSFESVVDHVWAVLSVTWAADAADYIRKQAGKLSLFVAPKQTKPRMWNGKQKKQEGVYSSQKKKKIPMAVYLIKDLPMTISNTLSLDSVP